MEAVSRIHNKFCMIQMGQKLASPRVMLGACGTTWNMFWIGDFVAVECDVWMWQTWRAWQVWVGHIKEPSPLLHTDLMPRQSFATLSTPLSPSYAKT